MTKYNSKLGVLCAVMIGLMQLGACAHAPQKNSPDQQAEIDDLDSLETFNRVMYKFNYTLDKAVLKPVTAGYRYVVPSTGRTMVSNFLNNLNSPVVFVNSLLQGDPQNSFATLWRFALNTTFGLGGLVDFAGNAGLKNRPADFGQTLAMYGVDSGSYVVLPLFGPSSVRDAVGFAADSAIDPLSYTGRLEVIIPRVTMTAIDARSRGGAVLDDIYENSIDPYATLRSAYLQKRASDIRRAEFSRQKALDQMNVKQ